MPTVMTTPARVKVGGVPGVMKAGGIAVVLILLFLLAPYFTVAQIERHIAAPIHSVMLG